MRRFRDLFDNAPVAYHELDMEGRILRVNWSECELLGYERREMIGRSAWDLVVPEDREASREAVRGKLNGTRSLAPVQRRYATGSGHEVILEIHDRLVLDSHGTTVGLRSAFLDITAQAAAERDLTIGRRHCERSATARWTPW